MSNATLSDKALSIFTFAAYHSLTSGEAVTRVVLDDGNGHRADADGVAELETGGFLQPEGDRGAFTETGTAMLARVLEALRGVAR